MTPSRHSGVHVRPWRSGDEPGVDNLLDTAVDPLWEKQFHGLHGPDQDEPSWRRCRVATDPAGSVIGAATVIGNPLHAGRMPCAIEVAPPWRRRGIGSLLLEQMKALRPDTSRPLSTKLRPDAPARAFVTRAGGRVYQRSPGTIIEASEPSVQRWAAIQPRANCTDLTNVDVDTLVAAFANLYMWTHQDWSPVTDADELMRASRQEVAELDRTVSTAVWVDGQITALALAFPSDDGVDVVAETIHPTPPRGQELLAGALATLLETFAQRGGSRIHIDGHITDPHLQPVLDLIPRADNQPVDLIEIDGLGCPPSLETRH